jgi:quercetin dioxygenase-like cupin family protein
MALVRHDVLTMTSDSDRAVLLDPTAGRHLWSMGMLMTIKASGGETGGTCSVMEVTFPPNVGPPLHVHHREAELNYVLRGTMRFRCGEEELECGAGGFVYLPKDVAHSFRSGAEGATMLAVALPGGIEGLYERVGEPAAEPVLPSAPPNIPGWIEHAASFGVEIIGPPLA